MKRAIVAALAVLALSYGAAAASAHEQGGPTLPTGVAPVAGTVVSADPATGTFVADAYVLSPQLGGGGSSGGEGGLEGLLGQLPPNVTQFLGGLLGHLGSGGFGAFLGLTSQRNLINSPATTQVTITTDPSTKLLVDGHVASVGDLAAGEKFLALLKGSPLDSIQTLTASPAVAVLAHAVPQPRQFYAFVGTVRSVDSGAGTVTVDVARSIPTGLVPPGSSPATFTVDPHTLVLGGSGNGVSGGSLSGVSAGDIVAGGLVGVPGETLAQVESQPLKVLLDFAAPDGGKATSHRERKALKRVLALLSGRHNGTKNAHKRSKHHGKGAQQRHH